MLINLTASVYLIGFFLTFIFGCIITSVMDKDGNVPFIKVSTIAVVWFVFPVWYLYEMCKQGLTTGTEAIQ